MDSSGEVISVEQTPPRFRNHDPLKQTFSKFDAHHPIIYSVATAYHGFVIPSQSVALHINCCFEVQNQFLRQGFPEMLGLKLISAVNARRAASSSPAFKA